jgi:hypothetical protein
MSVTIENETHWRSQDILRVVRSAVDASKSAHNYHVEVKWSKGGKSTVYRHITTVAPVKTVRLSLWLPRRGHRDQHRNPMMAVALAASLPDGETLLSMQAAFEIANIIGHYVATDTDDAACVTRLNPNLSIDSQPLWAPIETFFIRKYRDPKKDGTYLDFVKKKERVLLRATRDMKHAEADMEAAQKRLKKAEARKRAAEKSLQDARARRS